MFISTSFQNAGRYKLILRDQESVQEMDSVQVQKESRQELNGVQFSKGGVNHIISG